MLLKLISCNVFTREASLCLAESPHLVDAEFTELGEHINADKLRAKIQAMIDEASNSPRPYDAILLLFGLCGNACVNIEARNIPLVIPRAHDCCTVLMGSKKLYQEHFASDPSTPFSSAGYMERGDYFLRVDEDGNTELQYGDAYQEYVEQYGEENAKYIWEMMHPQREGYEKKAYFINIPEFSQLGFNEKFIQKAAEENIKVVNFDGSLRLIRNLLNGQWDEEDFVIIKPGEKTIGVYDWDEILRACAVEDQTGDV